MNYVFSLSNRGDCRLYNHTGNIIYVFVHGGRGFELVWMQLLRFIMFNNCPLYENITDLSHINDLKVALEIGLRKGLGQNP